MQTSTDPSYQAANQVLTDAAAQKVPDWYLTDYIAAAIHDARRTERERIEQVLLDYQTTAGIALGIARAVEIVRALKDD